MLPVESSLRREIIAADLHGVSTACREGAPGIDVQQVGRCARDGHQRAARGLLTGSGPPRNALQQPRGIRVSCFIKDLVNGSDLTDLSAIEDRDTVAEGSHNPQVVGNHDDRGSVFPGQPSDQLQDLRLYRDIQRRGRFVSNQQLRLAGQGRGDDDTLSLAAGELIGILPHAPLGIGDAYPVQHLDTALPCFLPAALSMGRQALRQLCSDGEHRVQIGHRILEDHPDAISAKGAE